jgi:hypothetical protein
MAIPLDKNRCILAAVDLSGDSAAVVRAAVGICTTLDRPLWLVHVIDQRLIQRLAELRECSPGEARRETRIRARRALERLVEEAHAPADTRIRLPAGTPVPGILSCVERLGPDLLVLGEPLLSAPTATLASLETQGRLRRATRVLLVSDDFPSRGLAPAPSDVAGGYFPPQGAGRGLHLSAPLLTPGS